MAALRRLFKSAPRLPCASLLEIVSLDRVHQEEGDLMNRYLFGLVALVLASCGADRAPTDNIDTVVNSIMAGATLIDVRTDEEIATGSLPGALAIQHTEIIAGVAALDISTDTTLVLYCRSGRRSGMAASALQAAGYTRVMNGGGYSSLAAALGTGEAD